MSRDEGESADGGEMAGGYSGVVKATTVSEGDEIDVSRGDVIHTEAVAKTTRNQRRLEVVGRGLRVWYVENSSEGGE